MLFRHLREGDVIRPILASVLPIVLAMQGPGVFAEQSSEPAQNQILLNDALATAGLEVTLHMRFETHADAKISRLQAEITFPVPQLSLVRVERPYSVEKVDGQVSFDEMGSGRIQVKIAVPDNSPEALPEEAVAFLVMQIAGDVEALPLTIGVENVEMTDLAGRRLEAVQDSQARINVVSEQLYPLISCFFYMH